METTIVIIVSLVTGFLMAFLIQKKRNKRGSEIDEFSLIEAFELEFHAFQLQESQMRFQERISKLQDEFRASTQESVDQIAKKFWSRLVNDALTWSQYQKYVLDLDILGFEYCLKNAVQDQLRLSKVKCQTSFYFN